MRPSCLRVDREQLVALVPFANPSPSLRALHRLNDKLVVNIPARYITYPLASLVKLLQMCWPEL